MSNDMENLRTFADQLWKYMVPKLDSKFASNVSYFRAEVVSNPGNNKLEVQRPVENGTLTLPCVRAMSGAQAGQQVVALVMGSMSNAIVVGDGNLNAPGGGGDAGIANFQAQPDGSLVITLTDGTTFTATPVINAFANVQVGSTTITADNRADTLTLVAGDNVTLTPNAANGSVTIAATDTTYSSKAAASGGTAVSLVTTGEKYTWNNKQNKLTFDTTPTAGSSNPVTSEGIKTALDGKSDTSHTHDNLYYKLTNGTVIPSGADLDDATYRTPGNYICETNAKAHTIKHFPGYDGTTLVNTNANAFKLFVGYAQGGSNYIAQELRDYYTGAVYYRWWYNPSWRAWRAVRGTASILISELGTATSNIKDSTLISTSDANGETGIWYRRAATTFWNYIKGKADAVYAAISHTHDASDITSGILPAARGGTGNGNGYIQIGQKNGTTLGSYATAEGNGTTASGGPAAHAEGNSTSATGNDAPHAEGYYTKASGDYGAHAEGYWTTASGGYGAHAEGMNTVASGNYGAHAEGHNTVASGDYGAHADGDHTIAAGRSQHVFGVYNISNTTDVEIVGWGASNARKNIRTLSTTGNEWISGTLTQASDAQLKDVQGEIPDLSSIRAVRFRWKNGDDKEHLGYLAQDVEGIAPYLVGVDSNGYKSLDYIALLTAKVEMLEREVMELKGR